MSDSTLPEIQAALERSGYLEPGAAMAARPDELKERLVKRIRLMLRHSYERLLSQLYLLDVREPDLRAALEVSGDDQKARALAEIVLAREAEKIASRKRYLRDHSVDASFEVDRTDD